MSKARFRTALSLLLPLMACDVAPSGESAQGDEPAGIGSSEMLAYLEAKIEIADDKFIQLAEAIPEDSYDWRPMQGVRSFREVFLHVASDNWYGGALMGWTTPDDIPITSEGPGDYEDQALAKAETLEHMRRSFDHLLDALDATRDRLDTPVMLRETEITYGDVWVRLVTHMHEHLGQTIAYSRANEIVPPWSR